MATNRFGFIQKKYRQPDYEREVFGSAWAHYKAGNGKVFIVAACTKKYGSSKWGDTIKEYEVCEQREQVYVLRIVPSQKQAMKELEQLLTENAA